MSQFETLFKEALSYAVNRQVVLPDEYYHQMTDIQRQTAISIKGLAQLEQIRHIVEAVNVAMAGGESFEAFVGRVSEADIELPKHRLDNIYRTNIQSAYNRGRWYEQQRNKAKKPYLRYSAVNDSRTRPEHKARHGIIRHINDPFWDNNYPPLGYRCRCVVKGITKKQMERWGLTPKRQLPENLNDGFGVSPKKYGQQFNKFIRDMVAKLMLENPTADLSGVIERLEQVKSTNPAYLDLTKILETIHEK